MKIRCAQPVVVVVLLLAGAAVPASAREESCGPSLREAQRHYDDGRFDEAIARAEECLAAKPTRREKRQAYALLAKTLLVLDEDAKAEETIELLLVTDPSFDPDVGDPPRFIAMVESAQQETGAVRISSVSKTSESLREAPATVTVITADEIARRGYLDLEQIFHDVSGFDVSRSSGLHYSNLYQRGYRSDRTNRTLVLVDGVEEMDLHSSAVYLSRQFPLANVERVEIIHGPASTMYGANAFAGVINVITTNPSGMVEKGKTFGARADVTAGSAGTESLDAIVAGRTGNGALGWSLSGRVFRSDDLDLDGFPEWDFDPAFYAAQRETYRGQLTLTGTAAEIEAFLDSNPEVSGSPYFTVTDTSIVPTEAGIDRAIAYDQAGLSTVFPDGVGTVGSDGRTAGFTDDAEDWLVQGKLELSNLLLGFQVWERDEVWDTELTDLISTGKSRWIPEQTWIYLKYFREINPELSIDVFSRYRLHELDRASDQQFIGTYFLTSLGIADLARETPNQFNRFFFHLSNSQLANEVKLVYDPSESLNLVGGVELRLGSVQGNFVSSLERNPAETGDTFIQGNNQFDTQDLGAYAQGSFRPRDGLKLVLGGRLDNNKVRESGGYGSVFNPRAAVIYSPGPWTFKAIYSEAFQDAPNSAKFQSSDDGSVLPNPDLQPETVDNLEVSAGWHPSEALTVSVAAYDASYSGVVGLVTLPDQSVQFQDVGSLEIQGVQVDARWHRDDLWLFANYTYTDAFNPDLGVPSGDIAEHKVNLGLNTLLRERLNLNVRVNYVGSKPVGPGTTQAANPTPGGEIDSYLVSHAALTYRDVFRGASLQLIVNNLFDEDYAHPGVQEADGFFLAPRVPQPERRVYLRLSYSW